MRVVLDYRAVNLKSKPDCFTIQEIRDCIHEIGLVQSDSLIKIDLTSGFWQQALDKANRPITSFTVPGKGLQGSPANFARLIDYVFPGLKGMITYIDNVLTHSIGHAWQLTTLEQALLSLHKYNLKLNPWP